MHITHVVDSLDPARGGPPFVATRLAAAQSLIGHDVRLVCCKDPEAMSRIESMLATLPASSRLEIEYLAVRDTYLGSHKSEKQQLRSTLLDSEIVHFHGVWERAIRWGLAAVRGRVPYVVAPHGMLDPWCLGQKAWKKKIALKFMFRSLLNGASFLHALNTDERRLLAPLRLTCPVEVIANGIFLQEFSELPEPGTFYSQHPELDGRPFVLFLSRLHYKKGLDYLAEAFQRVASVMESACLVVAGPDDGAREPFLQQIEFYGLRDRVFLTGGLYGQEKLAALVDAGCFCLPSRQEGFSIAILESLVCGTPVVVSEECHFPEIAEVEAGFVVPLAPRQIGDKLLLLLGHESLRYTFGSHGRELVASRFTWEQIAQTSIDCYSRLLSGSL